METNKRNYTYIHIHIYIYIYVYIVLYIYGLLGHRLIDAEI